MVSGLGPLACRFVCAGTRTAGRLVAASIGAPLVTSVATRERLVALTIGDGPDPSTTTPLLEVLRKHGARATFMLIGERVEQHSDLVDAIVAQGHEIAGHFMRDEPTIRLGRARFRAELRQVADLLRRWQPVPYYRPGAGWITPTMLRDAAADAHTCVLGSPLLVRAHYTHPERTGRRLANLCHPGAVVVLHEGTPGRVGVVPTADALLASLGRRDLRVTTVSELLASDGRKLK